MKSENKFFSGAFGWIKIILIALILAFGIRYFLISPVTVNGKSMDPTLHDGNIYLLTKYQIRSVLTLLYFLRLMRKMQSTLNASLAFQEIKWSIKKINFILMGKNMMNLI